MFAAQSRKATSACPRAVDPPPASLPSHRSLISKHSGVLDANIAYRFLATYPSPNKGYTALSECVVSGAELHTHGGVGHL